MVYFMWLYTTSSICELMAWMAEIENQMRGRLYEKDNYSMKHLTAPKIMVLYNSDICSELTEGAWTVKLWIISRLVFYAQLIYLSDEL